MPDPITESEGLTPDAAADALVSRIGGLQVPQIVHGRRAMILLEGPEGAGKKHALRQIVRAFDPLHVTVHNVEHERRQAADGHWLARFWRALPSAGDTAIFYRSWYRRVLDDRILGRTDEKTLARTFDQINEFEAQQRDYGTLIVKLYFDVSSEVQEARLRERASDPWLSVLQREEPLSVRDLAYRRALDELRKHSNTRWSPWVTIDADDERETTVAALTAISEVWTKAMPSEPPRLVDAPGRAA